LHVIRYVYSNPIKARIAGKLEDYRWSSYGQYINSDTIEKRQQFYFVLGFFNNSIEGFKNFHKIEDGNE